MSTSKRNKIILLAVTSILVLTLGFVTLISGLFGSKFYTASAATTASASFEGVSVRTKANSLGIRFTANVDHAEIRTEMGDKDFLTISNNVVTGYANAKYRLGMMVVPSFVLEEYEEGTDYINAIMEDYKRSKASFAIDFNAGNFEFVEDTTFRVSGALVNMKNGNLNHDYTALVYYTTNGGSTYNYMSKASMAPSTSISDVASNALIQAEDPESGVELDAEAKVNLKTIIANAVSMKATGSIDSVSVSGSEVSATFNKELALNETFDVGATIGTDRIDSEASASNVYGAMTYSDYVLNPNGSFASANVTIASTYGVNYIYNVVAYNKEAETDIETSFTLSDPSSIASISFVSNNGTVAGSSPMTLEHEEGKVLFVKENAFMNDEGTAYGVLDVTRTTGLVERHHIPLWSLFIDSLDDLLTASANYDYKGLYNGAASTYDNYGFYKLTADIVLDKPFKEIDEYSTVGRGFIGRSIYVYYGWEGLFDGNGHTISGLDTEGAKTGYSLVWGLGPNGIVKNVKMQWDYIGGAGNGGVVAFANGGTIKNCEVWCDLYIYPAGGSGLIVGHGINWGDIVIKDCVVYALGTYLDSATVAGGNDYPASAVISAGSEYRNDVPFTGSVTVENVDVIGVHENNVFGDPGNAEAVTGHLWSVKNGEEYTHYPFGADDGEGGLYGFAKLPTYTLYDNWFAYKAESAEVKQGLITVTKGVTTDISEDIEALGLDSVSDIILSDGTRVIVENGVATINAKGAVSTEILLISGWTTYKTTAKIIEKTYTAEGYSNALLNLKDVSGANVVSASLNGEAVTVENNCITLPNVGGEYVYEFVSDANAPYIVTVTVKEAILLSAIKADIKDGINSSMLLTYENKEAVNDQIASITYNGHTLVAENGVIELSSFTDAADASTYTFAKTEAGVDVRTTTTELTGAKIIGTSGAVYTANFSLYSILVNDEAEYKVANKYLDSSKKGIVKIANDITITSPLLGTKTTEEDQFLGQMYGGLNGFKGTVDGLLDDGSYATINYVVSSSFSPLFGGIAGGTYIKNLNLYFEGGSYGAQQNGIIARRLQGSITFENINVSFGLITNQYEQRRDVWLGSLFYDLYQFSALNLNNFVIDLTNAQINPASTYTNYSDALITAGQYANTGYAFKGAINVDGLVIIDTSRFSSSNAALESDSILYKKLFGENWYDGSKYHPVTLGVCVNLGENGITYYATKADYEAESNGKQASFTEVDAITIANGANLDLATNLTVDGVDLVPAEINIYYYSTATHVNANMNKGVFTQKTSIISFAENGTYEVYFRDADFEYYKVVITVVDPEEVAIDTKVVTDLKDGYDLSTLADIQGEIVSATIGDVDVSAYLTNNALVFDDIANVPSDVKKVASKNAQTLTFSTLTTTYTVSDFTIWSLIVSNEAEMNTWNDYLYSYRITGTDYTVFDGAITFDADINWAERTTAWSAANRLAGDTNSTYNGFGGIIDGAGHKIYNFNNSNPAVQGGLIGSGLGFTIKDLTVVYDATDATKGGNVYGLFGNLVNGATFDGVTVVGKTNFVNGNLLIMYAFNASNLVNDFTFKNVTINWMYSGTGSSQLSRSMLLGLYQNDSWGFRGDVYVDNVTIASDWDLPLVASNYFTDRGLTEVLDFGSGVQLADGAEKGVTFYKASTYNPADNTYTELPNEGAYSATYEEVNATAFIGVEFDFASVLGEGETFQYYKGNVGAGLANFKSAHADLGNASTYTFTAEGEHVFVVRTTDFKYYIVTVTVQNYVEETVETAFEFDLKGGINTTVLTDANGELITGATKVVVGGVEYAVVDGVATFGTPSAELKALASENAQSIEVYASGYKYTYTNVTLWSIFVNTADDLFIINDYLSVVGDVADGAIKFAVKDATIDFATRNTETYPAWDNQYRIGSGAGVSSSDAGFVGYIEGNGNTITNFATNSKYGGLIANATDMTIKNLNVSLGSFAVTGVFGYGVDGATLENVTLTGAYNTTTGTGVLFHTLHLDGDVNLKDVTIKFTSSFPNPDIRWGFFGAANVDTAGGYQFTGKVYVDNVIISSSFDILLVGRNYVDEDLWNTNVLDYGDGIVKAPGAEKGITFYRSTNLTGTAYEPQVIEMDAYANTIEEFDFASVLGEGETFLYYKGNVAAGSAGYKVEHTERSGDSLYQFTEVGTYKFVVGTTDYKYYHLTIEVADKVLVYETIDTAYEFDLREGIDTTSLVDSQSVALTGITGVTIGEQVFVPVDGAISFGEVASMASEVKALASEVAQTVVVTTEAGTYTYTNVTLWSIFVKTADDLFIINDYLSVDGNAVDGAIKFINDIDFATRNTETYSAWDDQYRIGNAVGTSTNVTGFVGYIEGNERSITNLNTSAKYGGLIANATNMTIKNLNVSYATFSVSGTFGASVNGANIENVTINANYNTSSGYGVLFRELRYSNDIHLKDVTLKFNSSATTIYSKAWGFFGMANSDGGYSFAGKIYVDNVVIGSTYRMPLVGYTYTTDPLYKTDLLEYGSGIVKADGAEKGITNYRNTALTGTAYEATAVEKEVKAYTTEEFDFSTVLGEGETFLYYKGNIAEGASGRIYEHTGSGSGDSLYQFTTPGTYKIAVGTLYYKYYLLTVTVSDEVRVDETIETAYAFDLKDGIDTSVLLDSEGNALTGVTGVNVNGVGFGVTEGVVSFGEVASMTDSVKLLASVEPRTVIVTADKGTYTYTNVSIWSLFVNDVDELKSMYLYQTTARKGVFKLEADLELPIISNTTTWDATWSLGAAGIVDAGFAGYFDGGNHTIYGISNRTASCNIFANINGGTVKNLTLSQGSLASNGETNYPGTSFDLNGILARYVSGETLIENVTVDVRGFFYNGSRGILIGNLARDAKVTLKDVNIFIDKSGLNNTADYYQYIDGIIASEFTNDSYINGSGDKSSTSEVYVNNVNIIGINVVSKWRLFGGSYHEYVDGAFVNTPRELGNGVSLAEGASLGINIYATRENFTAGTATYTVTSTVLDDITLAVGESLNAATAYTKNGGTPVSITPSNFMMSDGGNFTGTNTVASTLTFNEAGTYFVIFRDASYNHYIANVKVVPVEEIATAYAFDLKDGIDTSVLKDAEGNALTGVTAISYAGNSYSLTEGKATFGDVAEMSDDTKMLASATARALVVTTENGKYSYPNVTLWSIIVDNEEELRLMRTYAKGTSSTAKTGYYYINSDITLTPVNESDPTVTWKTEWQLGSGVWQAFNGVIDGGNHTISNVSNYGVSGGTIIGSANAATIKNINFEMQAGAASFGGLILDYSYSSTLLENVSLRVEGAYNYSSGLGLIANRYTQGMTLRNVKVFLGDAGFNAAEGAIYRRGLLLGQFENAGYGVQSATTGVKIDNLEIIGMDSVKEWRLFGGNLTLNNKTEFTPWTIGNGVVLADNATKGIVIYKTEDDYNNREVEDKSINITSHTVLDAINLAVNGEINAETTFTKGGEAVELTPATLAYGTAQFAGKYSYNGSLTFDTAGTFVVAIRDANYNYYLVTVTVA